jgi:hypothetical protein
VRVCGSVSKDERLQFCSVGCCEGGVIGVRGVIGVCVRVRVRVRVLGRWRGEHGGFFNLIKIWVFKKNNNRSTSSSRVSSYRKLAK